MLQAQKKKSCTPNKFKIMELIGFAELPADTLFAGGPPLVSTMKTVIC